MDRNRQLITGLGVALFLTCVVVVGTYWFYPRQQAAESALAASRMDFDPFAELEARRQPSVSEVPFAGDSYDSDGLTDADIADTDIVGNEGEERRQELTEDGITIVFGIRDDGPVSRTSRVRTTDSDVALTEPEETQVTAEGVVATEAAASPQTESAAPRTETGTASRQETPASATPDSEPRVAAQTTVPARASQEFWVQIFSGSSRGNADAAREKFYEETSLHPLMTTIDHEGQIFYRLRIGPYGKRGDAEQLLAGLASGSFSNSYISIVYN